MGSPVLIGPLSANTEIWLSDIVKQQNVNVPTRTKLNSHTTQAFNFEVITDTQFSGDITFTVIASDEVGLANTRQSTNAIVEFVELGTQTVSNVTFEIA